MKNMKLLKQMRNSGLFCCIKLDSDYMYTWTISVIPAGRWDDPEEKHVPTFLYDGTKSLNKAIEVAHAKCRELFPDFDQYCIKKDSTT